MIKGNSIHRILKTEEKGTSKRGSDSVKEATTTEVISLIEFNTESVKGLAILLLNA